MKTVVITKTVDDAERDERLTPRATPMVERPTARADFALDDAPVTPYTTHGAALHPTPPAAAGGPTSLTHS